jgi:hypothetical protein
MPSEAGTVGMWDTVGATFMTCRFGQGLFKEMHRGTCQGFFREMSYYFRVLHDLS